MTESNILILEKGWGSCGLSQDGKYRYFLTRRWARKGADKDCVLWIMLNPSTADHSYDDPTIRRCIGFSQAWGYRSLSVCNLWPFRSAFPSEMWKVGSHSLGPNGVNDSHILEWASKSSLIICAWGMHGKKLGQGKRARQLLTEAGCELSALRFTKSGEPCHPLYLPKKLEPTLWERAQEED